MATYLNGVEYEVTGPYEIELEDGQTYIYPLFESGRRMQVVYRTVDEAITAGLFRRKT
jgi:hypothetical protein